MMKVLSFVIPSYNSEQYLDKCITSIIDNSVIDKLEVIIVNDGSDDSTVDIAGKYCELYPNSVRLISQENKGHGGALNSGISNAKGKYFKVIDADDWVETQNLPQFVENLECIDSDVILTHHYTTDISNGEIKRWKSYPGEFGKTYSFSEIISDFPNFERSLTFHGITYKTEFYRSHSYILSEHVFYEDHEFATFPCCNAKSVTPLDLFIYNYRIGDVSQSVSDENQLKRVSHSETVLQRMVSEFLKLPDNAEYSRKYAALKIKVLLLSYLSTVLLTEPDKALGRRKASQMMSFIKTKAPGVYELSVNKYRVFKLFGMLHISKKTLDKFLSSKLYKKLKGSHDF